jgi:hypothetical protein
VTIRVIIADDEPLARRALTLLRRHVDGSDRRSTRPFQSIAHSVTLEN